MTINLSYTYEEILEVAMKAARAAGDYIKDAYTRDDLKISFKGKTNLVTQYDTESERIIIDIIKERFQEHLLLTEETHSTISDISQYQSPIWIVDPIDGTTNFAHRHYQVSISIGFSESGRFKVGVVYNPFLNEMYTGIEGKGSYRNNQRIHCSQTSNLQDALIVTGFPYDINDSNVEEILLRIKAVLINCRDLRRLGSGALDICWVADGRLCGYFESLNPWDVAAGIVIAREAGVQVGHYKPTPEGLSVPLDFYTEDLLFANPTLFEKLKLLLQ